jgi:uncharacterized protein
MLEPIICDTSVWLYLGRLQQHALLPKLYRQVYATETVCWELDNGRLTRPDTLDPRQLTWVHIVEPALEDVATLPANRLGAGERTTLAYARKNNLGIAGLDDRQARELARRLGLQTTGSLGVLLLAKQAGLLTAVRPLLAQLQAEGFYISQPLFQHILKQAREE